MNVRFPHWFCGNYKQFNDREKYLPFDQHELVALIAPRPIYIASTEEDNWSDQKGEFLGGKGAEPVYALYGLNGIGCEEMPPVDTPYMNGSIAYHNLYQYRDVRYGTAVERTTADAPDQE